MSGSSRTPSDRPEPASGVSFLDRSDKFIARLANLSAVIALILTVSQLPNCRGKLPEGLQFHWGVVAFFFGVSATIFITRWVRREGAVESSLRDSTLLTEDVLYGREAASKRFCRLCEAHAIVWLVGESGSGKSAFIDMGLAKAMTDQSILVPVVVNLADVDWESGPRNLLSAVLSKLSPEIHTGTSDEALAAAFEHIGKAGRVPCVIFDQFDDYAFRHSDRLNHIQDGVRIPVKPDELCANPFWDLIDTLLRTGVIKALFVARDASGLAPVAFLHAEQATLEPLGADAPRTLLERLTEGPTSAIDNAGGGWSELKEALVRDLSRRGFVLPAQMKMAFQGLTTLPRLTFPHYQANDGLAGLEAAHIEKSVAHAARESHLPEEILRTALITLVDQQSHKTVARTERSIRDTCSAAAGSPVNSDQLKHALDNLNRARVLRQALVSVGAEDMWQLYHDYLVPAVLSAYDKARAPAERLLSAADVWRAAPTLRAKWRALLPPLTWLRTLNYLARSTLGRQRVIRRFGPARGYVVWSSLRLLPLLLVVSALYAGSSWMQVQADASDIVDSFDGDGGLTPAEYRALWRLSDSGPWLRHVALSRFFANSSNAKAFSAHEDYLFYTVLQSPPSSRFWHRSIPMRVGQWQLSSLLVRRCFADLPQDIERRRLCVRASPFLRGRAWSDVTALERCANAEVPCDPEFAAAIVSLLRPEERAQGVRVGLSIRYNEKQEAIFARSTAAALEQLDREDAELVAAVLLGEWDATRQASRHSSLAVLFGHVRRSVSSETRAQFLDRMLDSLVRETDPKVGSMRTEAWWRVADEQHDRPRTDRLAAVLLDRAGVERDPARIVRWTEALLKSDAFRADDRRAAIALLLKVPSASREKLWQELTDLVDADVREWLIDSGLTTAQQERDTARQATAYRQVAGIDQKRGQRERTQLASLLLRQVFVEVNTKRQTQQRDALQELIADVPETSAAAAWVEFREAAVEDETIHRLLTMLAPRLSEKDATANVDWVAGRMRRQQTGAVLSLSGLATGLLPKVPESHVRPICDFLAQALEDPENELSHDGLADQLWDLTDRIPSDVARPRMAIAMRLIQAAPGSSAASRSRAAATSKLIPALTPIDASSLWEDLFVLWNRQPQTQASYDIAEILQALAARLSRKDKANYLQELIAAARIPKASGCSIATALVTEETAGEAFRTIYNWPVCSSYERHKLWEVINKKWSPIAY